MKPMKKERDWLSWDETEKIFGGIWEMETPCGRFFRVDLGGRRDRLAFRAVWRIKSNVEPDHRKAWKIARQCRFRKVDSIHFPAPPVPSFDYVPYGPEWEKEVMKNKKADIVDMFRRECNDRDNLKTDYARLQKAMESITVTLAREEACALCRQLRDARSTLAIVESGDAIVGTTVDIATISARLDPARIVMATATCCHPTILSRRPARDAKGPDTATVWRTPSSAMTTAPTRSDLAHDCHAVVIGSSVLFGIFRLTAAPLQCQRRGTESKPANAPLGAFFMPGRPEAAKHTRRVNRQEYNTRKGNTASAVYCVVEARHLRGGYPRLLKVNMQNETAAPSWGCILRLEDAIYQASAVADLVISRYLATIPDEDQTPHQGRVFAGLLTLESNTFAELEAAFSEVTSYARHLREQKEEKS